MEILNNNTLNMNIEAINIKIKDFVAEYFNGDYNGMEWKGVTAFGGKLCLRPSFQRSYIRVNDLKWKQALIESIIYGYPIALMYWGKNDDGTYECIDGQQRGITICDFVNGDFHINFCGTPKYFNGLPEEIKERILNYELKVNICEGALESKLQWFEIINQPIATLFPQELRNAVSIGKWLEDAKRFFSAPYGRAQKQIMDVTDKYCAGRYIEKPAIERQEILELALDWISYEPKKSKDERIRDYMKAHKDDENASELISYYKKVIDWIWATFLNLEENHHINTHCGKDCKGTPHSMAKVNWGRLYYEYADKTAEMDTRHISERLEVLLGDAEIIRYDGVYEYLLNGETEEAKRFLQTRTFSASDKKTLYKMQGGISPISGEKFNIEDMEAHHIVAWICGGKTEIENGVLLSKEDHKAYHHNGVCNREELLSKRDALWAKNDIKGFAKYKALKELEAQFAE